MMQPFYQEIICPHCRHDYCVKVVKDNILSSNGYAYEVKIGKVNTTEGMKVDIRFKATCPNCGYEKSSAVPR